MGQILGFMGYRRITGIDASEGMLQAAKIKGCYFDLHKMLLGAEIDLPPESFDVVTAAGVLTHGHAPPEALDGLVKVSKPGAPIIFSISEVVLEEGGFAKKISELEEKGNWTLEERSDRFRTFPFSDRYEDLRHWICVYRKC